jgi:D-aminopeptidase
MTKKPRARDLGIQIGTLEPGPMNAITDVSGVGVGHRTIIEGEAVRTGVTVVMPRDGNAWEEPVFTGAHRLNGNGEMTGLEWVRESGTLTSPIGLTNTHSVGIVRDALVMHEVRQRSRDEIAWALPVVAETWDGRLNDINGFHVTPGHVLEAIDNVSRGAVEEGSVGGGTGMISFGFKAGIGTASRVVPVVPLPASDSPESFTVGVLVQANFGRRARLTVAGVPIGRHLTADTVPLPGIAEGAGSVIVIAASDAPLLPHQCERVAQRISLGIGRLGGAGENSSGDLFLCFATGNRSLPGSGVAAPTHSAHQLTMLDDNLIDGLFHAVIEATEEAVLNAIVAAETMVGRDGVVAHALPVDQLLRILERGWFPLRP